MRKILSAMLVASTLLWAGTARAENVGQTLLQCVTVAWNAPTTFPPKVEVEVSIFGSPLASGTLDKTHPVLDFEYDRGGIAAKGRLSASFIPYEGKGALDLAALEATCDLTGAFPIKPRRLADFTYEAKFDY